MDKPAVDLALQTAFQHRASQIGNTEKFTSLLVVRRPTIYNHYSANRMMMMAECQKKCVLAKACRAKTSHTHLKKGVNMSSIRCNPHSPLSVVPHSTLKGTSTCNNNCQK
jgi:hypothetical protein